MKKFSLVWVLISQLKESPENCVNKFLKKNIANESFKCFQTEKKLGTKLSHIDCFNSLIMFLLQLKLEGPLEDIFCSGN